MDQICIFTCANEMSPASPPPLFLMVVLVFSNLFIFWNTCQVVKKLAFLCKHHEIQHNALLYFQWYIGFCVFIKLVMRPEKASTCWWFSPDLLHILYFFYFSGLLSLCWAVRVPIWQNPSFFCTHARTYETENLLFISIASTMEARVEARREFEIYGVRHLMWMNVHALM